MRGEGAFPGGFGWPQRFCVRTDRFRYDRSTRRDGETLSAHDHDAFLADLHNDPDEVVNVVNDPELGSIVDGLESMLAARFADAAQIDPDRYEVWKTRRDAYFAERWGARR